MPRGSEDIRHDATEGTAPASGTAVRPVAWANRRNARSDVTIAFAVHVLRPAVQSTMNAVTLPASRPLTAPAPPPAELRQKRRAVPGRLNAAGSCVRLHDRLPVRRNH